MRTLQNTTSSQLQRANSVQKVRAEVVLGSPSANCSGVGICRVMAHGAGVNFTCPKVNALLSYTTDGKLRFEFDKTSMEGRYMRRHFRWALFQVFEAYTVPYQLFGKLKLEQRTIQPGIYQVLEAGDRLIVEF
ncbi:MAG: hypothetical protein IPK76_03740 [Lewinellaceae bacterium]|nr:hypothetical protein [Lewinellaceae bacterium]